MDNKLHEKLKKAAALLLFSSDPEENMQEAWRLLKDILPEASAAFYEFLEKNNWINDIDPEHREALVERQANHWALLFKSDFSEEYVASTMRIGLEQAKFNISPSNYVYGYIFMLNIMMREINDAHADNPSRALEMTQAINSLMLIDLSLVLSLYNEEFVILD